jgi:hypothetical protein
MINTYSLRMLSWQVYRALEGDSTEFERGEHEVKEGEGDEEGKCETKT